MHLRPILSAMLRNKTGAVLVGLQIALTLAVVANSVFIIIERIEKIGQPSGVDSENIFFVQSYGYGPNYDHRATVRHDLDLIRSMPGVVAASITNGIPLSGSGHSSSYRPLPGAKDREIPATIYTLDEQGAKALGVKLSAGRAFTEAEVQYSEKPTSEFAPAVIITTAFGRQLFGEDVSPLGKTVYDHLGQGAVVVGVIDHMLGAWAEKASWMDSHELGNVIFHPRIPSGPLARYVVRTEPGQRDALIMEVERKLSSAELNRALSWVRPHDYYTERTYRADTRMIALLSIIVALMVSITALGIVGLASFYVSLRTKQIGTRRAVGARRIDIIRYFMLENWLLTTGGVVAGSIMAFSFGQWLSAAYSLPRLEPGYVAAGVLLLWILGQLAVYVPARRAAAIPPAIATRTV
jgi:putative ABC transport system permease protein